MSDKRGGDNVGILITLQFCIAPYTQLHYMAGKCTRREGYETLNVIIFVKVNNLA